MTQGGAKTWYFPDGDLPEKTEGSMDAHEALMVLNTSDKTANIKLDFYFSDREPIKDVALTVGAERCVGFRMDIPESIGGVVVPTHTQYGLRLRSDVPVVAQFARLDTTQSNMAYYMNIGHSE